MTCDMDGCPLARSGDCAATMYVQTTGRLFDSSESDHVNQTTNYMSFVALLSTWAADPQRHLREECFSEILSYREHLLSIDYRSWFYSGDNASCCVRSESYYSMLRATPALQLVHVLISRPSQATVIQSQANLPGTGTLGVIVTNSNICSIELFLQFLKVILRWKPGHVGLYRLKFSRCILVWVRYINPSHFIPDAVVPSIIDPYFITSDVCSCTSLRPIHALCCLHVFNNIRSCALWINTSSTRDVRSSMSASYGFSDFPLFLPSLFISLP